MVTSLPKKIVERRTIRIISYIIFMVIVLDLTAQPVLKFSPFNLNIQKNISNVKAIYLSSIGKEIKYIALETTPECLVRTIKKIEFDDKNIFIIGDQRLLEFDNNGRFIKQIGAIGRGPGEYLSAQDFCIDNTSHEIYIVSDKLDVYGIDGKYKYSTRISFRPAQIMISDEDLLIYHIWNVAGSYGTEFSWVFSDRRGNIVKTIKNYHIRKEQPCLIVGKTPLYSFGNSIHFMEYGVDTLYQYKSHMKQPYAVLDYGNLKMNPDFKVPLEHSLSEKQMFYDKLWTDDILENSDYLFLRICRGISGSTISAIFFKQYSIVNILKDNTFFNDIDGGMSFWPKIILNDCTMVDYVDAFSFLKRLKEIQSEGSGGKKTEISKQLVNLGKKLTETSNPVLILVK
jgi:hypothetical protein